MAQTYTKDMHETAKRKQLALVTIGYDGRYLPKPQGGVFLYGPEDERTLKEIQALILKMCKRK